MALGARGRVLVAMVGAVARLTRWVPPVGVRPVCSAIGLLWYASAPRARGAVSLNLRQLFGRSPRRRELLAVFAAGVRNYWDLLSITQLTRAELLARVSLIGREHLDAALARGHGAILAAPHIGSVSMAGQTVPAYGYLVTGLLEPIRPPELYALLHRQRAAFGTRFLPVAPSSLRELLAALRRNEVVALITDRDVTGVGPVLDFFGAPTRFPDGAAALSVRTGAPILPALAVRRADGWLETRIEAPLVAAPTPAGDTRAAVLALTHAVAGPLECYIASYPDQWTVFQERWPAPALIGLPACSGRRCSRAGELQSVDPHSE